MQQVKTTVTAVVLQGHFTVGALHLLCSKVPGWTAPELPFWLQIPKETDRLYPENSTHTYTHTRTQSNCTHSRNSLKTRSWRERFKESITRIHGLRERKGDFCEQRQSCEVTLTGVPWTPGHPHWPSSRCNSNTIMTRLIGTFIDITTESLTSYKLLYSGRFLLCSSTRTD